MNEVYFWLTSVLPALLDYFTHLGCVVSAMFTTEFPVSGTIVIHITTSLLSGL